MAEICHAVIEPSELYPTNACVEAALRAAADFPSAPRNVVVACILECWGTPQADIAQALGCSGFAVHQALEAGWEMPALRVITFGHARRHLVRITTERAWMVAGQQLQRVVHD